MNIDYEYFFQIFIVWNNIKICTKIAGKFPIVNKR